MTRSAWLFGTWHHFQGVGPGWQPGWVDAFLDRCATIVHEAQLTAVGEEAASDSIEAFSKNAFGGKSPLGQWCESRQLPYLAFDPTDQECIQLAIPQSFAAAVASDIGHHELAERLKSERFSGREAEWVRRLANADGGSFLLVIGSKHIPTMQARLTVTGWDVHVAEVGWTPIGETGPDA